MYPSGQVATIGNFADKTEQAFSTYSHAILTTSNLTPDRHRAYLADFVHTNSVKIKYPIQSPSSQPKYVTMHRF